MPVLAIASSIQRGRRSRSANEKLDHMRSGLRLMAAKPLILAASHL